MKGEIANPHWGACESCGHYGRHGCNLAHIDLSLHLGDFILCDDFVEANKGNSVDAEIEAGVNFIMDTSLGGE